jgi:AraC family transcriptional regulator
MANFAPVTLGHTVASETAGGFVFTDTVHRAGLFLAAHAHENAAVSIVTRGACQQYANGDVLAVDADAVMLEPAQHVHETRYGSGEARTFIVEILAARALLGRTGSHVFERYRVIRAPVIVRAVRRLAREFSSSGRADPFYLQSAAVALLAELACQQPAGDGGRLAAQTRDYVLERFASGLRLSELASAVGRNPMHVCKAFRAAFGMSIGDFARSLQLRHAIRELRSTQRALCAVAAEAGFADQSHFGRVFKAYAGMTPAAFRHIARSSAPVRRSF